MTWFYLLLNENEEKITDDLRLCTVVDVFFLMFGLFKLLGG
jgi:hypothetical protein